ncbi:phosphopentomutase [Alkalibacter saccharofermentans]|uniref:Phosphopentomutase n=1 Tax=Alkalibacter saccharofermentans DSM 14828 TaxID=1120975 RepID=A0A1M4UI67_9FIRM|nr:phosphopentomutase [Alkalibacter saccharofermentans]SHE56348.1 phosphopentomutase [Alkalibacter saccharofermentans DSM 14828]
MASRVIWLVIDSVGIGEMPDAGDYGDEGSNTLENLYRENPSLKLPNLEKMGLGLIEGVSVIPRTENPVAAYGKAAQMSPGKDTTTGHWEMAGIVLEKPFPLFPDGFPPDLIKEFENKIGRKTLGNYPASGTEIINVLGDEHVKTGSPIVYTSGDSVFQIAAHEDVISLEELYRMCETAREMLSGDLAVGRVIARPFTGKGNGNYGRTRNRHDYSLSPYHDTVLNMVESKGLGVYGVGKIFDIFAGSGITKSLKMKDNKQGMEITMSLMEEVDRGLIFVNLVDFDMIYGHRNDVEGYSNALMDFDEQLVKLIGKMDREDVLVINADHGCDPTTESTDHSREYVPVLVYGDSVNPVNIGVRKSFSDIGQTIAEFLQTESIANGESFAWKVLKKT